MLRTILLSVAALEVGAVFAVLVALVRAPEGYENRTGFHEGRGSKSDGSRVTD